MELLLNLLWLMLALPGVLILRRQPLSLPGGWRRSCPRCLIILGCVLVLLFPVVSATDDLHSASLEIEESTPAKRIAKLSPPAKPPALGHAGKLLALLALLVLNAPRSEAVGKITERLTFIPEQTLTHSQSSRAPPASVAL
jgi:hypothetical protein